MILKNWLGLTFLWKYYLLYFAQYWPKMFLKQGFSAFLKSVTCGICRDDIFPLKNWNSKSLESVTAWKVSKYGVISGPYFSAFGLNAGKYGPKTTLYLDTFHTVRVRQSSRENGKMENCRFPNGHAFFELYFTLFRKVFKNFLRRWFYRKIHPDV